MIARSMLPACNDTPGTRQRRTTRSCGGQTGHTDAKGAIAGCHHHLPKHARHNLRNSEPTMSHTPHARCVQETCLLPERSVEAVDRGRFQFRVAIRRLQLVEQNYVSTQSILE